MEYIVHYGYFECDGLKFLNSRKEVKDFIDKESKDRPKHATFFRVYEVDRIERIALEEIMQA